MTFETSDRKWSIEQRTEDYAYLRDRTNLYMVLRVLSIHQSIIGSEVYTYIYYQDCKCGNNHTAEIIQATIDPRNKLVALFAYGRTRNLLV